MLDTSALLLIADRAVDLQSLEESIPACILTIPDVVIYELQRIAQQETVKAKKAEWILNNVVPRLNIIEIGIDEKQVDEVLVDYAANRKNCIIVTSDRKLRDKALRKGIAIAFFRRDKRRFEVVGGLSI